MEGLRRLLGRREAEVEEIPSPAPLPRAPTLAHHWLTVAVGRPGPHAPIPVAGARVAVRWFPRGEARPLDVVARGTTGPDGTIALQLPEGRYAVSAREGGEGKAVTITLEHAGRATLLLESLARRAVLTVEVTDLAGEPLADAAVDVRTHPTGAPAARSVTDDDGVAQLPLPPGAYEVRVGDAVAKTYLEADTVLRLSATQAPGAAAPAPPSRYAQRVRAATGIVAHLDTAQVRDEIWN